MRRSCPLPLMSLTCYCPLSIDSTSLLARANHLQLNTAPGLQAANTSFRSAQGGGQGTGSHPKSSPPPGAKSFRRTTSKLQTPGRASQDGSTSVMSKMKRSMTLLAGRPVSEAGMTERSNRVSPSSNAGTHIMLVTLSKCCAAGVCSQASLECAHSCYFALCFLGRVLSHCVVRA